MQNHFNPENNTKYNWKKKKKKKKKKNTPNRGLLLGIKRDSSYVPLHRYKCGNKIPANNRLFIRKSLPKVPFGKLFLINSNVLLGDLINYAKTTETITKHREQMRLEDTNSTTKPTTSINALV